MLDGRLIKERQPAGTAHCTAKEVTSVTDEFWADYSDLSAPYGGSIGSDHLSSEERRLQTLRNFAMSKAAKARKKRKKQRTEPAEKTITEAERREQEQKRIREERQTRGALSEENRRQAAINQTAAPPEPERSQASESAGKKQQTAAESQDPEIDIALPVEKPAQSEVRTKKKKKTKQREPQKRAASASRYARTASAASNPNRITTGGAMTLGILTGVLIGTVIYGRVQTNEIYTKIAALQTEYDDLVARNVSMKSEMEGKMTVKNIEEYAEDVLGLMPLNQSQIEYIQIRTEDEVVISEPEDNFFVTINDYFVSIWEFLRGK